MHKYTRKVQYHETDKMGIVHHSNYIKWLEEARIDFLDKIECSYYNLENDGIMSPVISVECKYKHSTTFDDVVAISVSVNKYSGVKLVLEYLVTNERDNSVVLTGKTMHCFMDKNGKLVNLKKAFPKISEKIEKSTNSDVL